MEETKRVGVLLCVALLFGSGAMSQQPAASERINPFGCLDAAQRVGDVMSLDEIRQIVASKVDELDPSGWPGGNPPVRPCAYLFVAELMKRTGDYRAWRYYRLAIATGPKEPAFDLFLAEYLRVFRGAGRPQFPQAEFHYFQARAKLLRLKSREEWDEETRRRVDRGLVALYQRDGLALQLRNPRGMWPFVYRTKPYIFFGSVNTYGIAPVDIPEIDEVRDFTSEALFSSSGIRLNRPLTSAELAGIARAKHQFETLNTIRFRPGALPVLDLSYRYDTINDGQITQFFDPTVFNRVGVEEFGLALSGPWTTSVPDLDFYGKAQYQRIRRVGVVEFLPQTLEHIDHLELSGAVARFIGPDKLVAEGVFVYQDIEPDVPSPPTRNRIIAGGTLTYFLFRQGLGRGGDQVNPYDARFDPRGIEFFGGYLYDREAFGDVGVTKQDYFAGVAARGIVLQRWRPWVKSFDFTGQGTIFESDVEGDASQSNAQYRTTVVVLARIKDENELPEEDEDLGRLYPAFFHIVIPFKHDLRVSGISAFENYSIGVQANAKFYSTTLNGTTFLTSVGYTHQHFYRVHSNLHWLIATISMGF